MSWRNTSKRLGQIPDDGLGKGSPSLAMEGYINARLKQQGCIGLWPPE